MQREGQIVRVKNEEKKEERVDGLGLRGFLCEQSGVGL